MQKELKGSQNQVILVAMGFNKDYQNMARATYQDWRTTDERY